MLKGLRIKSATWYTLLFLCVLLALLPFLRMNFSRYLPADGFRDVDCANMVCPETQFCNGNRCIDKFPKATLPVPEGNE